MTGSFARAVVSLWLLGAIALAACGDPKRSKTATTPLGDTSADRNVQTEDPARELEVLLLENYLQFALGNIEAYADSIARERELMLVGVGPGSIVVGTGGRNLNRDRRPLRGRQRCVDGARGKRVCQEVLSKHLEVHLYPDQSVGWMSDEISFRVPVDGRLATIPLRATAVFVRDIDRWTMVMEHASYGLPVDEIVRLARKSGLPRVTRFKTSNAGGKGRFGRGQLARRLVADLAGQLNAGPDERARHRDAMLRKYIPAGAAPDGSSPASETGAGDGKPARENGAPRVIDQEMLFTLLPGPRTEYHDEAVHGAQSLAQLFGEGARVIVRNYRFDQAENRQVAWILCNLLVETRDERGELLKIGLRGTFLYAKDQSSGWNLVQRHISVPVSDDLLGFRIFGPLRPPSK